MIINSVALLGFLIGTMFTFSNVFRAMRGQSVTAFNMFLMALGWTMFAAKWIL